MGGKALIRYPATKESFLMAQQQLADTNAAYRAKFIMKAPEVLESNKQPVDGYCPVHRLEFTTDGRHLFTRSTQLQPQTCPVCDHENGYTQTEPWTLWRVQGLLESIDSTWSVKDYSPETNQILHMDDTVEFICNFTNEDGERCIGPDGMTVRHSVKNITALADNPAHIMCQGTVCDQKKKGKSSRLGEPQLDDLFRQRNSPWRVVPSGAKTTNDTFQIECLTCNTQVYITGAAAVANDPRCPLCTNSIGQLKLVNPQVDGPRIIAKLSNDQAELIDHDIVKFDKSARFDIRCTTCHTEFSTDIYTIKYILFCGCETCKTIHRQKTEDDLIEHWAEQAKKGQLSLQSTV